MCGIAGFVGRKNNRKLLQMTDILTHRGPDERGFYSDGNVSLGMRRLSIIDLTTGRQPIYNENKDVVVVFNGEIYNFPLLKKQLLSRGHKFYTKTDTEVIVHLYEDFQEDFVKKLDGMFAIALWDKKKKKLILCRDRFGKKPLYYASNNADFYFASEIKSILSGSDLKKELNLSALHHYLSLKHVPSPLTIYRDIYCLPAASVLVFENRKISIKKYWELEYNSTDPKGENEIISTAENLLKKAVEKRLISDVPIGAYLSGGVDSSLLVALYSSLAGARIKTFSLSYEEDLKNKSADREFAKLVSGRYQTEHHEHVTSRKELFSDIEAILACFDQPFSGVISTYFLSKLIKEHVKVAISGDGADELFGSYLTARLAFPMDNYLNYGEAYLGKLKPFENQLDFLRKLAEQDGYYWRSKLIVFSEEEKRDLYSSEVLRDFENFNTKELFQSYFENSRAKDELNRVLDVDCQAILTDQVLPFVDRLSMAHSIEVRCPYLDKDFSEYVAGLPGVWKIKENETKYILKKIAEKYLPKDLVHRKKEGFISPINQWLPANENYLKSVLNKQNLAKHNLFNQDYVERLIAGLDPNNTNSVNKVWTILNFQIWFNKAFA